jgi:phosphate transport system protein
MAFRSFAGKIDGTIHFTVEQQQWRRCAMRPREHYIQQLEALHTELRALGQMVIVAIKEAVASLDQQQVDTAERIVADDQRIDRSQYALEEHAIVVIATQQPMAGDLRRLVAFIEIASELERIGDYAKGIAKATIRNAGQPRAAPPPDIPTMAQQAIAMLGAVLDAFVDQDAPAARRLAEADDQVDTLSKRVRGELLDMMRREPASVEQAVDLLTVAHNLERIADRTTNIAERVIFMVSGDIVELNP